MSTTPSIDHSEPPAAAVAPPDARRPRTPADGSPDRRQSQLEQLRRSQAMLGQIERSIGLGTWEWDLRAGSFYSSPALGRMLGQPAGGLGRFASILSRVPEGDRPPLKLAIRHAFEYGRDFRLDHRILRPDGSERVVSHHGEVEPGAHGIPIRLRGVVEDVTERRAAELRLRALASYDELTGLPNRALFDELLGRALAQARRTRQPLAVLLLDLDRFRDVNESRSSRAGDEVLRQVAERLLSGLRCSDSVARASDEPPAGETALASTADGDETVALARRGGDEFLILLSQLEQSSDAARVGRRILEQLEAPLSIDGEEVFVTASLGIAIAPDDGLREERLLRRVETAMYSAKADGGNRFHFYIEPMNSSTSKKFELENRLHKALERDELAVVYQPLLKARGRKLVGVEALLRWNHPELGTILPQEFIPAAEQSGLIVPIGEWVLIQACAQVSAWRRRGLGELRIAVNLSRRQLCESGFAASVARILHDSALEPHLLELEITESSVVDDDPRTEANLDELKSLGVRLAIDDFGNGHTSLRYLRRLSVDTLKIDRGLVGGVDRSSDDAQITAAIIAIGRSLKLRVIAEGVESEAQMTFLEEHDCHEVQGFLLGRPASPEELGRRLAA